MKIMKITLLAGLIFLAGACDNDEESGAAVSTEEAAEMVASSLAKNSSGFTATVITSAEAADVAAEENSGGRTAACSYSDSETFIATNAPGAAVTYSYNFTYTYSLTCGLDKPQTLTAGMAYDGQFAGPRLASAHTGTADVTVAELDETSTNYLINAAYNRAGSFQSKIRNQNSSNSTVTLEVEDLEVNKITKVILGGSASVLINGAVTGKGTFTYAASVVFNGDDTATVTINGTTYMVDLITGDVNPE